MRSGLSLQGRTTGVFTISLDLELIWGTLDLFGPNRFRELCEIERREVIDGLLDLFEEYRVSATWCVVGHLFLERCDPESGLRHPGIVRPAHDWVEGDWFSHDPAGDEESEPNFYGRSLIQRIRRCGVPQEIGSHSFSHIIFGDPDCSREAAQTDIAECIRVASEQGIALRSFAFPRNKVGHLEVLRNFGFTVYRGPEPNWYRSPRMPAVLSRLFHLVEVVTAMEPPVVVPRRTDTGLWDVPGSMIYFPMHGLRRYIPLSLRVRRAKRGLDAAVRDGKVFHLWFHPTNLAEQTEQMFQGLREILDHARMLAEGGSLRVLPMASLVAEFDGRAAVA